MTAVRSGSGQSRVLSHLAGAGEAGREGAAKLRVFLVISVTYILFWGPLFTVTLVNWSWEWKDAKNSLSHEVSCCSAAELVLARASTEGLQRLHNHGEGRWPLLGPSCG